MDAETVKWFIGLGAGIVVSVIGYLLSAKDAAQEKQITELWKMHNEDAERLNLLTSRVDREYYVKHELDARFDKLESAFKSGFNELGAKFDRLAERLLERVK